MMMKKSLLIMLVVAVSTASAALTYLPESDYVEGVSVFNTGTVYGYIEYAVYDTSIQALTGYEREERFVYAYQVFNVNGGDIDAISIFGFDPLAVASDGLEVSDELDSVLLAGGKDATPILDAEDVKAYYIFDQGSVIATDNSWFLLMFSDYDWVKGDYEINPNDTDITVPGKDLDGSDSDGSQIPEPATLALLLSGGLLSLCSRKK